MKRGLMRRSNLLVAVLLALAALPLAGCGGEEESAAAEVEPVTVELVKGSDDLHEITLTPAAAERLDIQTAAVKKGGASGALVVPYSALVYQTDGSTWVYTKTEDLSFVRANVVVESIEGKRALVSDGPSLGTEVVTVGVAELFGAENGVGADAGH